MPVLLIPEYESVILEKTIFLFLHIAKVRMKKHIVDLLLNTNMDERFKKSMKTAFSALYKGDFDTAVSYLLICDNLQPRNPANRKLAAIKDKILKHKIHQCSTPLSCKDRIVIAKICMKHEEYDLAKRFAVSAKIFGESAQRIANREEREATDRDVELILNAIKNIELRNAKLAAAKDGAMKLISDGERELAIGNVKVAESLARAAQNMCPTDEGRNLLQRIDENKRTSSEREPRRFFSYFVNLLSIGCCCWYPLGYTRLESEIPGQNEGNANRASTSYAYNAQHIPEARFDTNTNRRTNDNRQNQQNDQREKNTNENRRQRENNNTQYAYNAENLHNNKEKVNPNTSRNNKETNQNRYQSKYYETGNPSGSSHKGTNNTNRRTNGNRQNQQNYQYENNTNENRRQKENNNTQYAYNAENLHNNKEKVNPNNSRNNKETNQNKYQSKYNETGNASGNSPKGTKKDKNESRKRNNDRERGTSTENNKKKQLTEIQRVLKSIDDYDILGVDKNCSAEEVRKAFRRLSKILHPDKNKFPKAEEAFIKINEAKDRVLKRMKQ